MRRNGRPAAPPTPLAARRLPLALRTPGSGSEGVPQPVSRCAMEPSSQRIKSLGREELNAFAAENLRSLLEDEALALLDNPHCSAVLCGLVAQGPRLTAWYSVP